MPGYANPPKEHQFKKGQSGNPSGPGKQVIARKILKQHTQASIAEAFVKLLNAPTVELSKKIKDPNTPIIEVIINRGQRPIFLPYEIKLVRA